MNKRPGHLVSRTVGDDVADLTEHRIVHRGIEVDLRRLARVAGELPFDPRTRAEVRWEAFGGYCTALSLSARSHLRVDTLVLPTLVGDPQTGPADGTPLFLRLLDRSQDIIASNGGPPSDQVGAQLATVLTLAARVTRTIFNRQQRVLFPLILESVSVADYRWVHDRFRAELPPGLLPFVSAWTMRHATAQEVLALTDPTLCVTHRIFAQRFTVTEALLFG